MVFGFPKSKRLLKTREFRHVFNGGLKSVSRHLVLFGMPSQTDRVGLVVSKKVGNAVVRNKVKRILREQFRQFGSGSPLPMDIVVVARHTAKDANSTELAKSLNKGISRLKKELDKKSKDIETDAKKIAEATLETKASEAEAKKTEPTANA